MFGLQNTQKKHYLDLKECSEIQPITSSVCSALYSCIVDPNVSQGSAATDSRIGGCLNSFFFCRSFLNLTVKNYENWCMFAEVMKR